MTAMVTEVTRRLDIEGQPTAADDIVGVARNVRGVLMPLNGLRHPREGATCGWYLWAGESEPSSDPDFFEPVHVAHLLEWRPEVADYLALPPGYRFLIAPGYEDIWFDEALLVV